MIQELRKIICLKLRNIEMHCSSHSRTTREIKIKKNKNKSNHWSGICWILNFEIFIMINHRFRIMSEVKMYYLYNHFLLCFVCTFLSSDCIATKVFYRILLDQWLNIKRLHIYIYIYNFKSNNILWCSKQFLL